MDAVWMPYGRRTHAVRIHRTMLYGCRTDSVRLPYGSRANPLRISHVICTASVLGTYGTRTASIWHPCGIHTATIWHPSAMEFMEFRGIHGIPLIPWNSGLYGISRSV